MKKHVGKYQFSQRIVKESNIFSTDCVLGGGYSNLNMFKKGHTKSLATIGRPRGYGRPHSQRCHRSIRSIFTCVVIVGGL